MVQLRSHPQVFKAIKIFQWFMTLTILILEVLQFVAYCQYLSQINSTLPTTSFFYRHYVYSDIYIGEVKYFFYIVIFATLFGLGYYLSQFHKQWGQGPNIMIDLNEESHDQCVYFSVSLIMGWVNTIAFLITTIVCKKIQWEKVKWGKERSGFTKEQQKEFFNQSATNSDKLNQTNNDSISINSRQITTPTSLKTTPKPLKISPEIANVNGGNMKNHHRRQESELYPEEPSTPVVCQQLIPQQHYHPDQRQEYDMDMEHSQHPTYSYHPENDQYEGYP
ncbi:14523_t:CDS:2 [Dentiscutata erythropus]|uniref:14523_t:CDS:1 n=1 Tax=Dentiscutata erythropus TaxID=1348616 RepID=A0A9N8VL47_9GLOM|nr:14523_t:CDS:2 [Dentiscutata erythropus]